MRDPELMTTGAAARSLGVTLNTVKNWIRKGYIQAVLLPSGHYRVARDELDRVLSSGAPAPGLRSRKQAWGRYENWRASRPPEALDFEQALQWNDQMLELADSFGLAPQTPTEQKVIQRRRELEAFEVLH